MRKHRIPINFDDTSRHDSRTVDFLLQFVPYTRQENRVTFFQMLSHKQDTLHIGCADWPIATLTSDGASASADHLHADMCEWHKKESSQHLFDGYDTNIETIEKMKLHPIFSSSLSSSSSPCNLYSTSSPIPSSQTYDFLLIPGF